MSNMKCDAQNSICQAQVMVTKWLPYAAPIWFPSHTHHNRHWSSARVNPLTLEVDYRQCAM